MFALLKERGNIPNYIKLYENGVLNTRIEMAYERLRRCNLCPRNCGVNRLNGERGFCRSGKQLIVSSFNPHFGEEPELVGRRGSGTIFFTNCSLRCSFCQNYEISHLGYGDEVSTRELSQMMLSLQDMGCHNINFVTPTHFVPQILCGIKEAIEGGLTIPLVYNCGGYEDLETLKLLDGIIDIYMPDAKFWEPKIAKRFCDAPDYPEVMKRAIKEMHRQVGDLKVGDDGIAQHGLLVRHLVLPHHLAGTKEIARFIAKELSTNTYFNVMAQYRPLYKAIEDELIDRTITYKEYEEARQMAKDEGLWRGF